MSDLVRNPEYRSLLPLSHRNAVIENTQAKGIDERGSEIVRNVDLEYFANKIAFSISFCFLSSTALAFSTCFSPYATNGLSHPYQMDESTFIFRGIRNDFSFLFHFSMKIMLANRIAPYGTPRFAASRLGLFYLPMSHEKTPLLFVYTYIQRLNASLTELSVWPDYQNGP